MNRSLIYEVNIEVPEEIHAEFSLWLDAHIEHMTGLPYFTGARLFKGHSMDTGAAFFKVHYNLASESSLNEYLTKAAPAMRAELPGAFQGRVKYSRFSLSE